MVHVHTQNPNEPSFGVGAYVCLGLTLTPKILAGGGVGRPQNLRAILGRRHWHTCLFLLQPQQL
jgi:hypothetical protein